MPVTNLKTGEQDFVDVSLVNKIVIDSEYIENMMLNEKVKIDFTLSGQGHEVSIHASNKEISLDELKVIKLQQFEEMLFKAINETKDQRLEEVAEFKVILNELIETFIKDSLLEQKHYAKLGMEYALSNGIGVIRDIKTNQDVGTFEKLTYFYDRNHRNVDISGVILSSRTLDDLEEQDRFELSFYSLENSTFYSVIGSNSSTINVKDIKDIRIHKFDLLTEAFGQDHKLYQMVVDAQIYKNTLEGIDESHPLYDTRMQEFRESRLSILEESKNKQKEEQLVSQFADIEIDF